jgi:hypothetical protein
MGHAQSCQKLLASRHGLPSLDAAGQQRHGHVFGGGQSGNQVELLKNKAQIFPPKQDEILSRKFGGPPAQHDQIPRGGIEQTRSHAE